MTTTWDNIPDTTEQTPLKNGAIKIRWSGKARRKLRRKLVTAYESGWTERGIAAPVMTRQKTQIVIKTEEELNALRTELNALGIPHNVKKRIQNEIDNQLSHTDMDAQSEQTLPEPAQRRKEETDIDVLLHDVVIPHARTKANDVWPGGTVDVDEINWFWNPQLSNAAGMAYHGSAVPQRYVDGRLAIGLAKEYYYKHGVEDLLEVVRHELIHIWQYEHPDAPNGHGHGPGFKQWMNDMDTHRHCNHW
jgi:hypothetical protein